MWLLVSPQVFCNLYPCVAVVSIFLLDKAVPEQVWSSCSYFTVWWSQHFYRRLYMSWHLYLENRRDWFVMETSGHNPHMSGRRLESSLCHQYQISWMNEQNGWGTWVTTTRHTPPLTQSHTHSLHSYSSSQLVPCHAASSLCQPPVGKMAIMGSTIASPQVGVSHLHSLVLRPQGLAINQFQFSY